MLQINLESIPDIIDKTAMFVNLIFMDPCIVV